MKYIVILIILAGGYWLMQAGEEQPVDSEEVVVEQDAPEEETVVEDDSNEEEVLVENLPDVQVFDVKGTNFAFDLKEMEVKKGATVTINFVSDDGFHDWVLDEFGAATAKVQTGGVTSVTFVASEVGSFEYYCSVGSHRANGMVGTLTVTE